MPPPDGKDESVAIGLREVLAFVRRHVSASLVSNPQPTFAEVNQMCALVVTKFGSEEVYENLVLDYVELARGAAGTERAKGGGGAIHQHFPGAPHVQNTPGGTSVTQIAGGNMTGVNASGEQKMRDITVYSQDLNQSGASINTAVRSALVEAREAIEQAGLTPALKPMVVEQFDRMTEELKKGEKKDSGVVSGLWNMVYGAIKAVPAAVSAVAALDKLKDLIGL